MITESKNNGIYQCFDGDRLLLTITDLGNHIYRAVNNDCDITAEILPIDEYSTNLRCKEHKRKGKDGKFRKTTKLLEHDLKWFDYILEKKGFIRKKKCVNK